MDLRRCGMDLLARFKVGHGWWYIPELASFVAPEAYTTVLRMRDELSDPGWLDHRHGERTTYKKGCHGPLCKKAMRDYGREYQRKANGHTRTRPSPMQRFDDVIAAYQKAYERNRDSGRGTSGVGTSVLEVRAS